MRSARSASAMQAREGLLARGRAAGCPRDCAARALPDDPAERRSADRRATPRSRPSARACGRLDATGEQITIDAGVGSDQVLRIAGSYQAHFAPMYPPRRIRSFVLRAGRVTAAQERALRRAVAARIGLDFGGAALDLDAVFGRAAPRCLEIGFGTGEVIGALARSPIRRSTTSASRCIARVSAGCCCAPRSRSLANLRVICHDAVEVLARGDPGSLVR